MVSATSKEAFEAIKHKLGDSQRLVYNTIKELGTATNESISEKTGIPVYRISGRVTDLKGFGMVKVIGRRINKTGHSANVLVAVDPNDKSLLEMALDCEV